MINLTNIKKSKKSFIGDFFYSEHFDAAIEILSIMASSNPNTNHIILDAPTQSGKTSVMEMVYRILNYKELYAKYGISNVIYLTADNGSGEGALKFQTEERFKKHWKKYEHTLPIRFLKRSDLNKYANSILNTLIIVDESQYGWREIESMCQKFLQKNGVNFTSGNCLCENNTYILSVSATTQNERYGDSELQLKPIVTLKTGSGYIGFKEFIEMGVIKPLMSCDFIDSYDKLDDFLGQQAKKLKNIYKKTKVAKCVILRLFDNRKSGFETNSEEFEDIVENNGFTFQLITCRDSKIDYNALQNSIFRNSFNYIKNGRKFHLVVIKNAFSYGITIDEDIKKLIATCYDVRKDYYSTEATEQGLLGRMSGYGCKKEDFEGLEIFVNEFHYNGIKLDKIYNSNEFSSPIKNVEKIDKVECNYDEWDGDFKNISLFIDKDYMYEGASIDDFFKRHKEFDYEALFKPESTPNDSSRTPFVKEIITTFCEEYGIDNYKIIYDRRRIVIYNSKTERLLHCKSVMIHKHNAGKLYKTIVEEAINKTSAITAFIDITSSNKKTKKGIKIFIRKWHIGFAKKTPIVVEKRGKRKKYSGYDTSVNGIKLSPIFI